MSTNKHIDKICIAVTVIALIATTLFIFGEKLGIRKVVDEDGEGYEAKSGFTGNDLNPGWDDAEATTITLTGDSAVISGDGAYTYNGKVVIASAGRYVISGELTNGSIIVDSDNSAKVFVKLNGVNVYCGDDAAFRVDQADKVFLTLADNTANSLESGETYSEEALSDNTGGTVFAHDDLTVNGNGSLAITASYKHGIDCNDKVVITGGDIMITAPQDGIHANDGVNITGASLTIRAEDDGISGGESVLIAGGVISVDECYEGIEAETIEVTGGDITIMCSDDGINANGGSSGFGGMNGGFDGMNKDFGGNIGQRPGNMQDQSEGKAPEPGGMMPDDTGMQTADSDTNEETWIHISGGDITILNNSGRDADGLDSNGDIIISGGNIRISLTGSGSNNAIDYGSESGGVCEISGGTVIACGGSSMAEPFSSSSTQGSVLYMPGEESGDDVTVALYDSAGKLLLSWDVPYSFTAVTISCNDLTPGSDYMINVGDRSETITLDEIAASYGEFAQDMRGNRHGKGMGDKL